MTFTCEGFLCLKPSREILLFFSIDVVHHNTEAIVEVFQSYHSTCGADRKY